MRKIVQHNNASQNKIALYFEVNSKFKRIIVTKLISLKR